MVFSGSVPGGMGFQHLQRVDGKCVRGLDAGSSWMLKVNCLWRVLEARPYLIKPNQFELEKLFDAGALRSYKEM
jgi:fructose-1-phosphate kinase PfkB-like protein